MGTAAVVAAALAVVAVLWETWGHPEHDRAALTHSSPLAPPVHLAPNATYVLTRVLPSGDLEVRHWISSSSWVFAVTLGIPNVAGLSPATVRFTELAVASDGARSPAVGSRGPGRSRTYPLPPTHVVYVRYRLSGVVERSDGSDGRAVARITALDVTTSGDLGRTTQSFTGATVLALSCTPAGRTLATPCGTERGGMWSVRLGPRQHDTQVMAQLALR